MAYINRIALLFALLLVLASCRRSHVAAIKQSMSLADSFPDRALNSLDSVRQQKMSDAEQPLYALAYTMALGKITNNIDVVTMITQSANGLGTHVVIDENDWEAISIYLENADDGFVSTIRRLHADLGINDLRFLMLVRIGFSTKTLAQIYCINEGSVKQRLLNYKAKLNITDSKMSVREYVMSL